MVIPNQGDWYPTPHIASFHHLAEPEEEKRREAVEKRRGGEEEEAETTTTRFKCDGKETQQHRNKEEEGLSPCRKSSSC